MRPTLFLHIGCHRTGTSSIQSYLASARPSLRKHGVLYPFKVRRHHKQIEALFSGAQTADGLSEALMNLLNKGPKPMRAAIMSDEDASMHEDISPLIGLKAHFDVKIVFSMRRQDTWLESWYFQNVKWQWNPELSHCTFDEFLAQRERFHWIRYDDHLEKYAEAFGAENILPIVFEKSQMPEGPIAAFCNALDLPFDPKVPGGAHKNASFSAEMVEFMRHLPLDELPPAKRDILRQAFEQFDRDVLNNTAKQSERIMRDDQRKAVLAEYLDGNQKVAREYFGRDELFMEPITGSGKPLAKLEIPEGSKETIERFVAPFLLYLSREGYLSPQQGN